VEETAKPMMNVLVTGHQGYIGAVMTAMLQKAGHAVTGLDTAYFYDCNFFAMPTGVSERYSDLRHVTATDLAGCDAIIHLAALSNDPLGDLNAECTYAINLQATIRLAKAAKAAGVERFIFASSCSIYGASGPDDVVTEESPLRPLTPYAESKVRAETALAALADYNFTPVFLRNATAYGVSPRLRVDLVVNNLVAWALTTGKIRILSDGAPWRPLVHVQDICRAAIAMLEAPRTAVSGEPFNVGRTAEVYQVRRIAELVQEVLPECAIEVGTQNNPDPRSYRVNCEKLFRTLPDLVLDWTVPAGIVELVDAYRRHPLTLEGLQGRRFVRIQQLKYLLATQALDADLFWKASPSPVSPHG
jgi:nucleoside-diphosphate-sugar epimerase